MMLTRLLQLDGFALFPGEPFKERDTHVSWKKKIQMTTSYMLELFQKSVHSASDVQSTVCRLMVTQLFGLIHSSKYILSLAKPRNMFDWKNYWILYFYPFRFYAIKNMETFVFHKTPNEFQRQNDPPKWSRSRIINIILRWSGFPKSTVRS